MRSPFIITILNKHLNDSKGAVEPALIELYRPHGLMGLILGAVRLSFYRYIAAQPY